MIGNTTLAESLIGVFVALVLFVTFRRKTHKAIELAVWIGLIWACLVAVTGIRDPQMHALTTSAAWGTSQVVGTIAGAFKLDALRWTYGARFSIADWVVLLVGADVLALALVSTNRQAGLRMPATKLREWWVLPRLAVTQPLRAPSAVDEINRRFNTWSTPAAAATAMWSTLFLIWLRDVEIPIAAQGMTNMSVRTFAPLRRAPRGQPLNQSNTAMSPRTKSAHPRKKTNGSKKHRPSRLAS